jgi:hypothetical protein
MIGAIQGSNRKWRESMLMKKKHKIKTWIDGFWAKK